MKSRDSDIAFDVVRSRRATADIVIERDGRVLVRAPEAISVEKIEDIVEAKRYWIYKNLAEWRDLNATRVLREYQNGEGFLYLGRSYRLSLVTGQLEPLKLHGGRFLLRRELVETGNASGVKSAFRDFYRSQGLKRIGQRVLYFSPKTGVEISRLDVRDLGNRWATYSPSKGVAFHWKCVMAPPSILDYIVVHELCHAHYLNHTEAFWNEVDKVLPTYRERREWLKRNGAGLDV